MKATTKKKTATKKAGKKSWTPAAWAIEQFGGVRALASVIGRNPGTISRWTNADTEAGKKGIIPGPSLAPILTAAQKKKLDITAEDLIFGRKH